MTSTEIKKEIERLDILADDDTISNEEFDAINNKIASLCADLAQAEEQERIANIKNIKVNAWLSSFLSSFSSGTIKITNKQAEIFKRYGKEFAYNGRIYNCSGPNYRVGFSTVFIQDIKEA